MDTKVIRHPSKQAVKPAVAVKLGKLFGNGAGLWLRMQAAYDLWHAERDVDVSGIADAGGGVAASDRAAQGRARVTARASCSRAPAPA